MAECVRIRQLETTEELKEIQSIERAVWNMDPIPLHQTFTAIENGGLALGAYDGEQMIGYVYGFPGFKSGKVYLCSHMLGILPEYRGRRIGERLKKEQARLAREQGYGLMTWTFDPLESRNAHLNLNKLRARGAIYSPNHYGELEDDLNQGLPSDRLIIEWDLEAPPLAALEKFSKNDLLLDTDAQGQAIFTRAYQDLVKEAPGPFFIKVPLNFQAIKTRDIEAAKKWRRMTQDIFLTLFKQGFQATDLLIAKDEAYGYYALRKV